ncbi:MAG: nicotinate phosphoribosyltransferase [Planctomycetes bacterium]|nr:nicotinate phosphoribosyltransferase [Planctomycetota bacterium]
MKLLSQLYRQPLGLLTDLYQLTMAYGYWKLGLARREAVFHLIFRRHPFGGGFTLACGLEVAAEFLEALRFDETDIEYLSGLAGSDGRPLFEQAFLDELLRLRFSCDIDAMPEGTVAFPQEPLVRVQGPLIQGQIIETPLLNLINFQSLVATKAARVCLAARGDPVLEFGLRRAQGIDGGVLATRAAYAGGCDATSNVLAGRLLGIPVRGTHAHSWVMCFEEEIEAFRAYARALPGNCIFLVDTYETIEGVRRAAEVGRWLRERGHELVGIRLDSGDLAALSVEARRILDDAGFPGAVIVASSDLDEHAIESLKAQGARISVWGVGTKLATAYDEPALGGVYKLGSIRGEDGRWRHRLKRSDHPLKVSNPGRLQVRRRERRGVYIEDVIYDVDQGLEPGSGPAGAAGSSRRGDVPADARGSDLLVPVFRGGRRVLPPASLEEIRRRVRSELDRLDDGVKRLTQPAVYEVGIEKRLSELKARFLREAGSS